MTASLPIPPWTANLVTVWTFLEEGIDHIMEQRAASSYPQYISLYTAVYNYCTGTRIRANKTQAGAEGPAADLYNNLVRYFALYLKVLRDQCDSLQDEALLYYYIGEWDRYTASAAHVDRAFTFLNRYWVNAMRNSGSKEILTVYNLALVQWKTHIFLHVQNNQKLTGAILRLIEQQRHDDTVDPGLLKKVVDSFVSLGIDETDTNKVCLDVYEEHFENPFINATKERYKQQSESFLAGSDILDYLKRVEKQLREDEDRVEKYLNMRTRNALPSRCYPILIYKHAELIRGTFKNLLDCGKDEDLRHMYAVLSRIPQALNLLCKQFEEHVKKAGLMVISNLVAKGRANVDPKAYVDALLEVYQKNAETVNTSFSGEAGFVASLDKACRGYINRNPATGSSSTKSLELLVKYADMLLKKKKKIAEGDDLEGALNGVRVIFEYLEDKDVFQTFYASRLSMHLIHGVSLSGESEASMISKLKQACGSEYTNKLQRMLADMSLSKDITDQFNERSHGDIDVKFSVMVLGTNSWSLNAPSSDFIIPPEIFSTYDRFQNYYQVKYSGRRLTWLWNYSKNELRTNYLRQKYILMTSSYQMAVLLQYNENDSLSLNELVAATLISKDILAQALSLLVRRKILINEGNDQYDINLNFESKKIWVNLNLPIKARVDLEPSDVLKTTDERKYIIQATIIRIMKARKTMTNQALIPEIVSQISQKFAPKIPDIKKAIDTLLEKEYIERVGGTADSDTFAYVV